jgi:hypothetical protein
VNKSAHSTITRANNKQPFLSIGQINTIKTNKRLPTDQKKSGKTGNSSGIFGVVFTFKAELSGKILQNVIRPLKTQ